jgi:hypothetical protein
MPKVSMDGTAVKLIDIIIYQPENIGLCERISNR